uniref:Zgc: n=1 Tax=Parastrongyloides trichosuri TaxID=131310 RepID=A0A0N4ZE54_PARTI
MSECDTSTCTGNEDNIQDIFILSSRRGRRNALHEYSKEHTDATAHQLSDKFSEMGTNCGEDNDNENRQQQPIPNTGEC